MPAKPKCTPLGELVRSVFMIAVLVLPVLIMFGIWGDTRRVPHAIMSGALFGERWHIAHAGFFLDQPTIGKWYF